MRSLPLEMEGHLELEVDEARFNLQAKGDQIKVEGLSYPQLKALGGQRAKYENFFKLGFKVLRLSKLRLSLLAEGLCVATFKPKAGLNFWGHLMGVAPLKPKPLNLYRLWKKHRH